MLNRLYANLIKEFRILLRDRSGLIILYLMPLLLVVIMVFVQQRTFNFFNEVELEVLFLDQDQGKIGAELAERLNQLPQITLITHVDGKPFTKEMLLDRVAQGEIPAAIIVPEELTRTGRNLLKKQQSGTKKVIPAIEIYFDPAIKPSLRNMLNGMLNATLARMESALLFRSVLEELRGFGPLAEQMMNLPDSQIVQNGLLQVETTYVSGSVKHQFLPNAVQHNIPGWTLFAMFFIVIPLAAGMIQERNEGMLRRLMIIPLFYTEIVVAKILLYLLVCLSQFSLMLFMGKYLMPLLGLAQLQIGTHPEAVLAVALAASLAAIGYGILVGTWASTHQQASSFGAVSIIIAAALGGIWVPVFIMPELMQQLSDYSPLAWALRAFHQVFLRNGTIQTIQNEIILLLLFFLFTLSTALIKFRFNKN